MRASRLHLIFSSAIIFAFSITMIISLVGFFSAVEKSNTTGSGEGRVTAQLKGFHDQLKHIDEADALKRAFKSFDLAAGYSAESDTGKELRKAYSGVLSTFANKPKEAESRYLLVKKREMMEYLVNAYRKEIPRGDIRVRAIYLNVLFDMQSSLLNESDEMEEVFIRRNKERVASLKSLVAGMGDAGLVQRVAGFESLYQAYEKGFGLSAQWRKERDDVLGKVEKNLPKLARELYSNADVNSEDMRRSFLLTCVLAIAVALGSAAGLLVCHKVGRLQFDARGSALVAYLREFGRERSDPQVQKSLDILRDDPEWSGILLKAQAAEDEFVTEYQTHLALPKSLQIPYVVFTKDRIARLWNESAANLLGIEGDQDVAFDDLVREEKISLREGDAKIMAETIRGSFPLPKADSFEFLLKRGDAWVPVEMIVSPIVTGRAAGGKIYCFREIRNEADRINQAVNAQLARVREFVQKVTHFYPAELTAGEQDAPAVHEMAGDLNTLKRKIDEREILWKSETSALIDQVERQKEILQKLQAELGAIRTGHEKAIGLFQTVQEQDESLYDQLCLMERDMDRWQANRSRLLADLTQYESVIQKATRYEKELRDATEAMRTAVAKYEKDQRTLAEFADQARVQAVNLGLTEDKTQWEYADRARLFAETLQEFSRKTADLLAKVSAFLQRHPGGALAPHLSGVDLDPAVLEAQKSLAAFFQNWRENGNGAIEGGQEAIGLLQAVDKKGAVAVQLGDTSILINEQAKGNLSRWN